MTRSIFDPGNPNVERSGDRFTAPDARQISKMPPDVIDGVVDRKGDPDAGPDSVSFDGAGNPRAADGLSTPNSPPGAGPLDADDVDADGAMDEVQDAHAVGIEKRNAAES